MLSQHLEANSDSFCGQRYPPVGQPGPGFWGVFLLLISSIEVIAPLQFCCLFFDRSPPDCLRQRPQFAFVLFKSESCPFQELSVPVDRLHWRDHTGTMVWPSLIFGVHLAMLTSLSPPTNLMAHYTHLLKHIRHNVLILTLSVPMQSNRTWFFFLFQVALMLTTSPVILSGTL